ncbi:CatA-like O-acetyltransferase [Clostridium butyricum]
MLMTINNSLNHSHNLNSSIYICDVFLFPMVTWGKFFEENNKIIMPLTIQVHHAVADGYHCSLFFSDVEEISRNPEQYLILC